MNFIAKSWVSSSKNGWVIAIYRRWGSGRWRSKITPSNYTVQTHTKECKYVVWTTIKLCNMYIDSGQDIPKFHKFMYVFCTKKSLKSLYMSNQF